MSGVYSLSQAVHAELTATCDALGYNDGSKIRLDKNCIEVIKDLIRFLRRDDETHGVRRFLGQSEILQKDLLKIFTDNVDNDELWNVLLRLLINLTCPALMLYNEEVPTEKISRTYYEQIVLHLQQYKKAMADENVWLVVNKKLQDLLSIDISERTEDKELIIERILTLMKNVLRVPAADNEITTDNDITVHDELLFALHTSGITDLLIYIASSSNEQRYHMQILGIVVSMLHEQKPEVIASAEMQRSAAEKQNDEAKLLLLRERERQLKLDKIKKYGGARHSRFGGIFVVQNMKSIGENEMICHKPYQKIEDLNFSVTKQKIKKRMNKNIIVQNESKGHISALSVRLFLKEFCIEFLNGAYNPIMRYARTCIFSGESVGSSDTSYYLWTLYFFMCFSRHHGFNVKYISETISTEIFYLVQRQMDQYHEMILVDKKKIPLWVRRLHYAVNAYKELLLTIMNMDKSTESNIKNSTRVIMSNLFYTPEYRQTILTQFMAFDDKTMSKDYLIDLVTTTHIFMKMLKAFCDKQRHVVVQKPVRRRAHKSKKSKKSNKLPASKPTQSAEDRWDDIGSELSAVLQENAVPEVIPFDATLEKSIDDQKADAMVRIQKLLRKRDYEQAIGLLRSARNVWPENDSFGRMNLPTEEEFLILREIYFADLGVPDEDLDNENVIPVENFFEDDDNAESDENEEEEEPRLKESEFDFMEYLQRFANVKVIRTLAILFRDFEVNTPEVNHYVLKMLHRIAVDCKMSAMIFQASIFRIFQKVFLSKNSQHKDLKVFAQHIFRQFAECASKNPKAYMELLFWKTSKTAAEMIDGYEMEHNTSSKKSAGSRWTEAEEDELRTLFMEHQTNKPPQDLIDYILSNLISQDRTRRGVMKKLKEMYLIVNSKSVRSAVSKRLPKEWGEDEIAQLTELWDRLKEDDDPIGLIYDALRIKRPKSKIKEKLLELKLAEDRKEFRKKRQKNKNAGKSSWETREPSVESNNSDQSDQSDSSDSENEQDPAEGSASVDNENSGTVHLEDPVSLDNSQQYKSPEVNEINVDTSACSKTSHKQISSDGEMDILDKSSEANKVNIDTSAHNKKSRMQINSDDDMEVQDKSQEDNEINVATPASNKKSRMEISSDDELIVGNIESSVDCNTNEDNDPSEVLVPNASKRNRTIKNKKSRIQIISDDEDEILPLVTTEDHTSQQLTDTTEISNNLSQPEGNSITQSQKNHLEISSDDEETKRPRKRMKISDDEDE